jgi:hypothetical protein
MREARIRARAIPELQAALEANQVTLYRAGEIAKLPASQQAAVTVQWTTRAIRQTEGQTIASRVIREALRSSRVDLSEIASAIRAAIALARL